MPQNHALWSYPPDIDERQPAMTHTETQRPFSIQMIQCGMLDTFFMVHHHNARPTTPKDSGVLLIPLSVSNTVTICHLLQMPAFSTCAFRKVCLLQQVATGLTFLFADRGTNKNHTFLRFSYQVGSSAFCYAYRRVFRSYQVPF